MVQERSGVLQVSEMIEQQGKLLFYRLAHSRTARVNLPIFIEDSSNRLSIHPMMKLICFYFAQKILESKDIFVIMAYPSCNA